jgi:hypothetical protein
MPEPEIRQRFQMTRQLFDRAADGQELAGEIIGRIEAGRAAGRGNGASRPR